MVCKQCGNIIDENSYYCVKCGCEVVLDHEDISNDGTIVLGSLDEPTSSNPIQQPPIQQPTFNQQIPTMQQPSVGQFQPQIQSFDQFYEVYANSQTKSAVKWLGIICIISASLSLIFGIAINPICFIDVLFYGVFSVLLFKKRNWIILLIVAIYSALGTALTIALGGVTSGVIALVLAIVSTINMKKIDDAYKQYKTSGILPAAQQNQ